jgi:2-C-methyl-D-erythritol 2,4-cyclodiphosphate synthase
LVTLLIVNFFFWGANSSLLAGGGRHFYFGVTCSSIPLFASFFASMKIRTGFGYDVHQLQEGLPFWLGGIQVPHTHGALGHSDADVLIHVICDALLGAANLRDIGFHFPDTDPQYKGIDSKRLLAEVVRLIRERGYSIGNIDSTICLERPKVNPHIAEMQRVLAEVMQIDADDISIKATTTEKLGFVGRQEGVAAYASVLISKP